MGAVLGEIIQNRCQTLNKSYTRRKQAVEWYKKAAEQGNGDAKSALNQMTPMVFEQTNNAEKFRNGDKVPYQLNVPESAEVQAMFLKAVAANDTAKMKMFLQHGATAYYYNGGSIYSSLHGATAYYYRSQSEGIGKFFARISAEYPVSCDDPLLTAIDANAIDAVKLLINNDRRVLLNRYGHFNERLRINNDNVTIVSPLAYAINKSLRMYLIIYKSIFYHADKNSRLDNDIQKDAMYCGDAIFQCALAYLNARAIIEELQRVKGFKFGKECKIFLDETLLEIRDNNMVNMVNMLIDLGADPNYIKQGDKPDLNGTYAYDNVLIRAAERGFNDLAKALIDGGANVSIKTIWASPLYMAVQRRDNLDFIKFLIEKGANVNFKAQNSWSDPRQTSVLGKARGEYKEFLILNGAK